MRRRWGWPLIPAWVAGTGVKNWLYDRKWLRQQELAWPVVSVGSLSAGGAGKTPVVKMLADVLQRKGLGVDVLSRGYGRTGTGVVEVMADGAAAEFGDEPVEMARAGLRVFVGADRTAAGRLAEDVAKEGVRVHLLDDGFQRRRLKRVLDVVLVTRADGEDALLPAGNLREGWGALQRADVVILREDEVDCMAKLGKGQRRLRAGAEVWVMRREMVVPAGAMGRRVVGFCGVARPEGFFAGLEGAGIEVAGRVAFRDHQRYGEAELRRLATEAKRVGATAFVTTAKDAVKLGGVERGVLGLPVEVVELRCRLVDEEAAARRLVAAVRGK